VADALKSRLHFRTQGFLGFGYAAVGVDQEA